jgi:predicted nucleotidyltransferase
MGIRARETSLSSSESALLERFSDELRAQLGDGLHAVWLFGSRARGERPAHEDSDIDVLVLVEDDSWEAKVRVRQLLDHVADDLDLGRVAPFFSVHVNTRAWLAQRRAIQSFFVGELDRDKIVIEGSD